MKSLERSNEEKKVADIEKMMMLWELKAVVECYSLAFPIVVVKCIAWFPLPLNPLFCLSAEYLGNRTHFI